MYHFALLDFINYPVNYPDRKDADGIHTIKAAMNIVQR
jgi:hypothetical protein